MKKIFLGIFIIIIALPIGCAFIDHPLQQYARHDREIFYSCWKCHNKEKMMETIEKSKNREKYHNEVLRKEKEDWSDEDWLLNNTFLDSRIIGKLDQLPRVFAREADTHVACPYCKHQKALIEVEPTEKRLNNAFRCSKCEEFFIVMRRNK